MLRKESDYVDYGIGSPGYAWEVRLYCGDDSLPCARAFGPNVSGTCVGEFRDLDAVTAFRALPDGPIDPSVDVAAMLSPLYARHVTAAE
jgi:hypothetical protein